MESTVGENGKLWNCKVCSHNSRKSEINFFKYFFYIKFYNIFQGSRKNL